MAKIYKVQINEEEKTVIKDSLGRYFDYLGNAHKKAKSSKVKFDISNAMKTAEKLYNFFLEI